MPKGGKRKGAGRKETGNITFPVRGLEAVKEATRQFAKTESEKIINSKKEGNV